MSSKPRNFQSDCYYHIYNRGVGKQDIFNTLFDYQRFLNTIEFYLHDQSIGYAHYESLSQSAKQAYDLRHPRGVQALRVGFIAYCLMPNHYHIVLKTLNIGGITRFMSDISNSYTRYFNTRYGRNGYLLESKYQSKEIKNDESMFQVVRYVSLNPIISTKTNKNGQLTNPANYPFSSYKAWIGLGDDNITQPELVEKVLTTFGGLAKFKSFVESKMEMYDIGDLAIEESP